MVIFVTISLFPKETLTTISYMIVAASMPKVVAGYKDAARARIIEAALDVFTRKGFDASTMDEVAEKIGVSKAAVYRYFSSKDALLEELFKGGQRHLRNLLKEAFEKRSLKEGTSAFFDEIDRLFGGSNDLIFEWFAQAYRDERLRKFLKEDGERDIETISAFLVGLRKKGSLHARTNPKILAQILETAFIGAWIRIAMGHDRSRVMESLHELLALVMHVR